MKVLVGYDGSALATAALRWASRYARAHDDEVQVVRAWQYPASTVLPIPARPPLQPADEVERALRTDLDTALGEVVTGQQPVEGEVVPGPAADVLLERAAAPGVRAVVIGSRGLGGFSWLLLGSVTRACLEHATVPVVVLPNGADRSDPATVLVGLDGSEGSAAALDWAMDAARALGAAVVAVSAFAPDQAELPPDAADELRIRAEAQLERWCRPLMDAGVAHRCLVLDGDPRSVLLDAVDREGADLVVVGSRGMGPVARLLLGSVASALAQHCPVPLAVVPTKR